jgi:serine phosphatase RsbU (regulator of sigma subunit)
MALAKQDLIHKGALVATELDMAEAVQRNLMADNVLVSRTARIAYHYQPASRLGGDWFFLIDDKQGESLYVIMGDVTGHGLAQGLVTTAVKGALDVIEHQMKLGVRDVRGPAAIVQLLETVVSRVAGRSELSMTCLAAQIDFRAGELRICNAGHTFPILLRSVDGVNHPTHLHLNQQPMLGYRAKGATPTYVESVYQLQPRDLLVVYTDGLTEAKNLKSQIFSRFLFRSLKQPRTYAAAEELKDEILAMFRYYTQSMRIEDDVCFLVVQMRPDDGVEAPAAAS